jgi:hypothetical protein
MNAATGTIEERGHALEVVCPERGGSAPVDVDTGPVRIAVRDFRNEASMVFAPSRAA